MNSRDPLSEAVLMHCGVSRKIPCLAGSPPVPLCSLRVVVPGLPSLISACPQSLTRSAPSPIPDMCLGPSGTVSGLGAGPLPSPKFLPCPRPQDVFSQDFSLSTHPVCCAWDLTMGRQHLPAVLCPAHHSPTAAVSSPRRDGMVQSVSSRSAEGSKAVKISS